MSALEVRIIVMPIVVATKNLIVSNWEVALFSLVTIVYIKYTLRYIKYALDNTLSTALKFFE